MEQNDPSTGEIVRELTELLPPMENYADLICAEGAFAHSTMMVWTEPEPYIIKRAIDRLESDVRTIADKDAKIASLTARAEQAEKWAAAAITDIERLRLKKFTLCPICEFEDMIGCAHKNHCTGYEQFKWRGLPQEGERKSNG